MRRSLRLFILSSFGQRLMMRSNTYRKIRAISYFFLEAYFRHLTQIFLGHERVITHRKTPFLALYPPSCSIVHKYATNSLQIVQYFTIFMAISIL